MLTCFCSLKLFNKVFFLFGLVQIQLPSSLAQGNVLIGRLVLAPHGRCKHQCVGPAAPVDNVSPGLYLCECF